MTEPDSFDTWVARALWEFDRQSMPGKGIGMEPPWPDRESGQCARYYAQADRIIARLGSNLLLETYPLPAAAPRVVDALRRADDATSEGERMYLRGYAAGLTELAVDQQIRWGTE
jgi:hypothetical protein